MGYLDQPRNGNLYDHLSAKIALGGYGRYTRLSIMVAYAKLSGVARLQSHIAAFTHKGGKAEIIVGIGQKNTSKEAVETLCALNCAVSIFHNPLSVSRTFHPKLYLLQSEEFAWISVGSSNLTGGGLVTNYEWNHLADYDLSDPMDAGVTKSLYKQFLAFSASAIPATQILIDDLHSRGALPKEQELWKQSVKAAIAQKTAGLKDIFPGEKFEDPPSGTKKLSGKVKVTAKLAPTLQPGFWKKLSTWDVNPKSSPGQIQIPIAFSALFPPTSAPSLTPSGALQADTYLNVLYIDATGALTAVSNARLILYPPAPGHKRPNDEYRFTFRDKGVFSTLKAGDVLAFRRSTDPAYWFEVRRITGSSAHAMKKFGYL